MKYLFFSKRNYIRLNCRSVNILAMKSEKEHQKSREKTLILTNQATRFAQTHPPLKKYNYNIWICNS